MEFVKVAEDVVHVLILGPDDQPIPKTDPATGEALQDEFETEAVPAAEGFEVWESTADVPAVTVEVLAEALEAFEGADVVKIEIAIGGRVSVRIRKDGE